MISRDFHAKQPYEKLLTDITEFTLPDGKLYLSAMIDCLMGWLWGERLALVPMLIWSTLCWLGCLPSCQTAVIRRYIQTEDAITDVPDGLNE